MVVIPEYGETYQEALDRHDLELDINTARQDVRSWERILAAEDRAYHIQGKKKPSTGSEESLKRAMDKLERLLWEKSNY